MSKPTTAQTEIRSFPFAMECHLPAVAGEWFFTDERVWIRERLNHASEPLVSIADARLEPGVTTQLHRLRGIRERYVITTGTGRMLVGNREFSVLAGDVVVIDADESQRITNTGMDELCFECVCTPRFVPESYESLEEN